jgi:hypothetical protein
MKLEALAIFAGLIGQAEGISPTMASSPAAVIKRLPPTTFAQLPRPIRRYLERRRCTVPQSFVDHRPHNVISGAFIRRGRKDWAVLCSNGPDSVILVFVDTRSTPIAELSSQSDEHFLQTIDGKGQLGYSRIINRVGRRYIMDHYQRYGGTRPPRLDHDGIDDGFAEKASVVLYYSNGRWLELTGAD